MSKKFYSVLFALLAFYMPALAFSAATESGGYVAVDIENYDGITNNGSPRDWYLTTPTITPNVPPDPDPNHSSGANSGAYMETLPDTRVTHDDPNPSGVSIFQNGGEGPELRYDITFNNADRY